MLRLAAFLIRAPTGGFFDKSSDWRRFFSFQDHLKKIEKEFGGRDGAKLVKMAPKAFAAACKELFDGMRPTLNKCSGPGLLKEYSPWLHNFHTSSSDLYTDTIEVPGQNV